MTSLSSLERIIEDVATAMESGSLPRDPHTKLNQLGPLVYKVVHCRLSKEQPHVWFPDATFCQQIQDLHVGDIEEKDWRFSSRIDDDVIEIVSDSRGIQLCVPTSKFRDGILSAPAVRWHFTAGFAGVFSRNGAPNADRRTRFYFNLAKDGLVWWISTLLCSIESKEIPYVAKVANSPVGFGRADAGVLVVDKNMRDKVVEQIEELADPAATESTTSAFCKEVVKGISYADDYSNSSEPTTSFGLHRSFATARALLGETELSRDVLRQRIEHELLAAGIQPNRTWATSSD